MIIISPIVQQMVSVDLRTIVLDIPTQDVISRDNVSVKVNAVLYFRVIDPQRPSLIEVPCRRFYAIGEMEASAKLLQAADILATQRQALQLRYLQTLTQIAGENSSTIVFPMPIDIADALKKVLPG